LSVAVTTRALGFALAHAIPHLIEFLRLLGRQNFLELLVCAVA
jgi:hypothetical protein